jgi:hypothetical protein
MRLIFGVIIGIALTVGGAYLHDTNLPAQAAADPLQPAPPASVARNLVNWDVAGALARQQTAYVKSVWDRAFGNL